MAQIRRERVPRVVVVDADNTLYNWVRYFSRGLRTALYEIHASTSSSVASIQEELRAVFEDHGTVDYSAFFADDALIRRFGLGKAAVSRAGLLERERRRESLRPYGGVVSGLAELRAASVRIVVFSDSRRLQVLERLATLRLLGSIDACYCADDDMTVMSRQAVARLAELLELAARERVAIHVLPSVLRKPNPAALTTILDDEGVAPEQAVLLGDNLAKDVAMAKVAGVFDCWARYGSIMSGADADLLVGVTNWSSSDVKRFFRATPQSLGLNPSVVVDSFNEFADWCTRSWRFAERIPVRATEPMQLSLSQSDRVEAPL